MWSVIVVVHAPSLEHGAGMWQGPKQRFVEHFVPEPADEGFGEGILRWFAWRNVVPGDLVIVGPAQDGIAGQLGAVVTHDHLRLAALDEQAVELAGHPAARDRCIRDQRQARARAVINHNQDAQPPGIDELIGDKVDAEQTRVRAEQIPHAESRETMLRVANDYEQKAQLAEEQFKKSF
jgi:hypothetical protein